MFDQHYDQLAMSLAHQYNLRSIALCEQKDANVGFKELIESSSEASLTRRIPGNSPWYLFLTSGTTGTPKAVIQMPHMSRAMRFVECNRF